MKRFVMMTAIALGLAALTPACGGMPGAGSADSADGKPIDKLKALSEGIQKDVDGLLQPINDADAAIDAVAKLPAELKGSIKGKVSVDDKKIAAVVQGLLTTGNVDISSLGLDAEAEAKAKVEEAFAKLKTVVDGIKTTDQKVVELGEKIKGAVVEIPTLAAKATANAQVSIGNPLSSAETKASAQADLEAIKGIADGFKTKSEEWTKALSEVPTKAKAAQDKLAKAFTK